MELRHLRYFRVLAEELHFGRAAARLHISQPPLTTHIKDLEREVGTPLFERTTRRVSLTSAGEIFAGRVTELLAALDEAVDEVRDHAAGKRGRVRVGFVSSASATVLPPALRAFRDTHPDVRVDLFPLTTAEQIDALTAGSLEVGLIRSSAGEPGLSVQTLAEEPMVAVLPTEHPLAKREVVEIGELVGERLILFPNDLMPGYTAQVWSMFASVGARPHVVQEAVHHETVVGLVSADVGISILPESVSRLRMPEVVTRSIAGAPTTELMIARRAEATTNPAAEAFVECLYAAVDVGSAADFTD
ncbi:LysR substrate-binding domain-containing protein [Gordonia rhizosphera]|uniref:Putative LysR family transcriptional regulator n=1 Tax=Gordonia rhizosphera NBRC 16068 TaxID=1108045 RepID=K6WG87_9ACTN|nr:LysR substrate-binding domain-containing protein [Gordonia rhizosphera]GAB91182.1 putative LysR family transcriptional regulator [Gordonia rhizosphera NBRC 16068]